MRHPWSDAWILQAIVLASCEGEGALHDVVAAADATQHALPTFAELSSALVRLVEAGFVREVDGCFRPTPLVSADVVTRIASSGWQEGRETASTFLDADPDPSGLARPDARNTLVYPGLTRERVARAEVVYRQRLLGKFQRLRARDSSG